MTWKKKFSLDSAGAKCKTWFTSESHNAGTQYWIRIVSKLHLLILCLNLFFNTAAFRETFRCSFISFWDCHINECLYLLAMYWPMDKFLSINFVQAIKQWVSPPLTQKLWHTMAVHHCDISSDVVIDNLITRELDLRWMSESYWPLMKVIGDSYNW